MGKATGKTPADLLREHGIDKELGEHKLYDLQEINELTSGFAYVNDKGHLCVMNKNGEETVLANFVPIPLKELVFDNGKDKERLFEIKGVLGNDTPLPTIRIKTGEFPSLQWITEQWGIKANIGTGYGVKDKLRHTIQSLSQNVDEEYIFSHLGWRKIDGEYSYLHGGGSIGQPVNVELEFEELKRYSLPSEPLNVLDTIPHTFRLLNAAPHSTTLPLLSMVGLAPFCEMAKEVFGNEPPIVLWVLGKSGARKSTLCAVFLSHFGNFHSKGLPASFKDTWNSLEKKAFLTKDSILLVDDFYPPKTKKESELLEQTAQNLLRGYGDRVGRTRMKQDTSIREGYAPRGICIVTGENEPNASTSTSARYFPVKMKKGEVDLELLTDIQRVSKPYLAHTTAHYIEWIRAKWDELKEKMESDYYHYQSMLTLNEEHHGRIGESSAWLMVGLDMFLTFAVEIDYLEESEKDKYIVESISHYMKTSSEHHESIDADKPTSMFIDAIQELINAEKVCIESASSENYIGFGFGEKIGYYDDHFFYLRKDITFNQVIKFYKEQDVRFPLKKERLLAEMEEEGKIRTGVKRTIAKLIPKKGKAERFIWLYRDTLKVVEEEPATV